MYAWRRRLCSCACSQVDATVLGLQAAFKASWVGGQVPGALKIGASEL